MEDPESEWAIQEYAPSKEGETTMMRWILNKGYGIGKKMVITGIAISSAPLVLPPLVVFSAMGVAFSVPFGLVFASYVCTHKLMSKLLPTPPPPLMLEYYSHEDDQHKEGGSLPEGFYIDEYEDAYEDDELRREYVMQEEEQRIEDIIFESDEGRYGYGRDVEALATNVDVDEKGYYTDEDDEVRLEDAVQEDDERSNHIEQKVYGGGGGGGGDDYRQYVGVSISNVDENINEEGSYIDENEEEEEQQVERENMFQEEENEQVENLKQGAEVKFGLGEFDEKVDEDGRYIDENKEKEEEQRIERENMFQDEEIEQVENLNQGGGLEFGLGEFDEKVNEEVRYIDENKEEENEQRFQEEEKEQIDDLKQGAEISFGLDDMDKNVDEERYETNENEGEKESKGDVLQRESVIEEEEKEQMEDIKQGVEMRLGFDVVGDEHYTPSDESVTKFGGNVDDQGYEEDVGEYLEGDDDTSVEMERVAIIIDENNTNTQEVDQSTVVTNEIKVYYDEEQVMDDEEEEIVKGSTGLLEKLRDEGEIVNTVEDESASNGVFEEDKDVEKEEPVMVNVIDSQELVVDESKNEEPIGVMRHVVILANGNEDNNFNAREIEELDLVAKKVFENANNEGRKTESGDNITRESMGSQKKSDDAISRTNKEDMIRSNADAREIGDESGLDLFDERSESTHENTSINFETLGVGDVDVDEIVDVLALPSFKRAPLDSENAKADLKHARILDSENAKVSFKRAPLDSENATVASKAHTKVPSKEDILEDEKIWEKIGAMRRIVGYIAPSQPTCIGELKALYVFTGVEPPASFKDDSDLDEVNVKLKFLMSIVGVR